MKKICVCILGLVAVAGFGFCEEETVSCIDEIAGKGVFPGDEGEDEAVLPETTTSDDNEEDMEEENPPQDSDQRDRVPKKSKNY